MIYLFVLVITSEVNCLSNNHQHGGGCPTETLVSY